MTEDDICLAVLVVAMLVILWYIFKDDDYNGDNQPKYAQNRP